MSESKKHIAWIEGSYFSRYRWRKDVQTKLENKSFSTTVVDDNSAFVELLISLSQINMFNEGSLVIVSSLPNWPDANKQTSLKKLKKALDDLPDNIYVIFDNIDFNKEKSLYKHIESIGKIISFPYKIKENETKKTVLEKVKEHKMTITDEAADAIAENCMYDRSIDAYNIDILESYLLKLKHYKGRKKKIDLQDIESTIDKKQQFIIWSLLRHIENKDAKSAMSFLSRAKNNISSIDDILFQILNIFNWKFRMILFLKDHKKFHSDEDPIESAMKMIKMSGEGSGFSRKYTPQKKQSKNNDDEYLPVWSKKIISMALAERYNQKSDVEKMNRRDLYRILKCINYIHMLAMDYKYTGTKYLFLDLLIMCACDTIDYKYISNILHAFEQEPIDV